MNDSLVGGGRFFVSRGPGATKGWKGRYCVGRNNNTTARPGSAPPTHRG